MNTGEKLNFLQLFENSVFLLKRIKYIHVQNLIEDEVSLKFSKSSHTFHFELKIKNPIEILIE